MRFALPQKSGKDQYMISVSNITMRYGSKVLFEDVSVSFTPGWVQPIASRTGMPAEEVRTRLVNDGCYNIAVAGMILRGSLNEAHGNQMRAVGYYHSHTPGRGQAYRVRMINSALALYFPQDR